jgi:hypothetical protein
MDDYKIMIESKGLYEKFLVKVNDSERAKNLLRLGNTFSDKRKIMFNILNDKKLEVQDKNIWNTYETKI